MVKETKSPDEIQNLILYQLWQIGAWGGKDYKPMDKFLKRVSTVVKNNGKNTKKQWNTLMRQGLAQEWKKNQTCSLNLHKRQVIKDRLQNAGYPV